MRARSPRATFSASSARLPVTSEVENPPALVEATVQLGVRTSRGASVANPVLNIKTMLEDKDVCVRCMREGYEFFKSVAQRRSDLAAAKTSAA
jgi:hypothetical protein